MLARQRDAGIEIGDQRSLSGLHGRDRLAFALPLADFVVAAVHPEEQELATHYSVHLAAREQAADLARELGDEVDHSLMTHHAREADVVDEVALLGWTITKMS